jgi:hypothetical protein
MIVVSRSEAMLIEDISALASLAPADPEVTAESVCPHELRFALHVRNDNRERTPPLVRLKAPCGPGDNGEPVVTVMMPDED